MMKDDFKTLNLFDFNLSPINFSVATEFCIY